MATVTVRVVPRSGRTGVRAREDVVVVWVRAAPEGGRATDEARRALAEAAGVSPSAVRLRTGVRSRTKVFDVAGIPRTSWNGAWDARDQAVVVQRDGC